MNLCSKCYKGEFLYICVDQCVCVCRNYVFMYIPLAYIICMLLMNVAQTVNVMLAIKL